jgi:hypothetical protein
MTSAVVAIIGLTPLLLLLGRMAVAIGSVLVRALAWLIEEPEGFEGAAARLFVVTMLLHAFGLL